MRLPFRHTGKLIFDIGGSQTHAATFAKVVDGRKQPIRGSWIRSQCFAAQKTFEKPVNQEKRLAIRAPHLGAAAALFDMLFKLRLCTCTSTSKMPGTCRSASRVAGSPYNQFPNVGFRGVLASSQP